MRAKEFLSQAYLLDQRIKNKSEQIQRLNELATNCSVTLSGMPHEPSKTTSPMADAVCKIIDLENEIAVDMNRLVVVKKDIKSVIDRVENIAYNTILEQRYICGDTWEVISQSLNFNKRWTMKIHEKALDEVQKILDNSATGH